MVLPISGPFRTYISLKGPPTSLGYKPTWLEITRYSSRQRKPYNLPLAFSLDSRRVTSFYDSDPSTYKSTSDVWYGMTQAQVDNTYNRAYAKFIDKINDTADMGTNLAEHEQAKKMITSRLIQLARFSNALRRFRFGDAANALGISRSKLSQLSLRKAAKSFGNNWLEFHFGWSPLIGDIWTGMNIVTSGLPPFNVKARHSSDEVVNEVLFNSQTHKYFRGTKYHEGWELRAQVEVDNPNLWLAGRLGLVNPASLAWELVPFSFVADWFVNVGDVIRSYTDTIGLRLLYPSRTEFRQVQHTETELMMPPQYASYRARGFSSEYISVGRSTSIPGPTLRVRPVKALSWVRGLTAASLLVQSLKG